MRQFHIQSAIAESQHVFTPYSNKGGHIATYLKYEYYSSLSLYIYINVTVSV